MATQIPTAQPDPQPTKTPNGTPNDPNLHFYQWLNDNNYEFSIDALPQDNPLLEGKGFVLTDRPLLVFSVKRKNE